MRSKAAAYLVSLGFVLPAASADDEATRKRVLDACRSVIADAVDRNVIRFVEWSAPNRRPRVGVGPAFYDLSVAEREQLAKAAHCFILQGHADTCVNMDFYDLKEHVGRGRDCRYLDGPGR